MRAVMGALLSELRKAAALASLFFLLLADIASADQFLPAADGWQTYVNDRFHMRFDYPAEIFSPEAPPENGDGRRFSGGEASLEIVAWHNIDRETPSSLKSSMVGSEGYTDVTYSPKGNTWLVLSGFRGDRIFYEKYAFNDGIVTGFGIEFPAGRKPYYSPIVERIEDSFRAGRSD
jgi:hypothetical protein